MTHVAPLVTVILTSSLLTWAAAESSISCIWRKVLPTGEVHYSFIRRASPSLRLYHSAWSGERTLLSCAWSDDAALIQSYLSLCRESTQEFSDHPDGNFDVRSMFEAEDLCVSVASPGFGGRGERTGKRPVRSVDGQIREGQAERSEVRTHKRVKRGFIVPGTLWCGAGNKAPSYADLGVFAETDRCCRQHDHCKHTIQSFHSNFGVFNRNIFTLSHCGCDRKFRRCLMKANDSISDVVGYTFFNVLKMHCFYLSHQLQCKGRNWFGMCKETEMALHAEVHPPTPYQSSNPTKSSITDPQISSITSVTTFTVTSTPEGPTGPVPESRDDLENTLPTRNQTPSELDAGIAEKQLSCAAYKDLDKCQDKILPQQQGYGLLNPEATTLYHCNCTTRLFQTLVKQRHLTEVQALLLGHVSQSCFLPQDCTAGQNCAAVLVKTDFPQLDQRSGTDMEEQHHLQAVSLKVRRPNTRRAKRKDGAVRLHKLCLRMVQPKLSKNQDAHRPAVRQRELVQM